MTANKKEKLESIINMEEIKFKEIDELVEIFQSWNSKVKLDME